MGECLKSKANEGITGKYSMIRRHWSRRLAPGNLTFLFMSAQLRYFSEEMLGARR